MAKIRRNTPTGVGKRVNSLHRAGKLWKHPHGRGEELIASFTVCFAVETPPRAWGRAFGESLVGEDGGNTPTGVGKS